MTNRDHRLARLSSWFTAQERALLVLRASKEGRAEDPVWRWSMPPEQAPEFNRLLDLIDGVNERLLLLPLVLVLGLEVDKLELQASSPRSPSGTSKRSRSTATSSTAPSHGTVTSSC